MARTWEKLHHCWLGDEQIEQLRFEDQARWIRLLLYVGIHGERGTLSLRGRWQAARVPLGCRFASAPVVLGILARLPGIDVATDPLTGEPESITFRNWYKYQVDDSSARVKSWRQRNDQTSVTRNADSPVTRNGARSRSRSREEKNPPTPLVSRYTPHPAAGCSHFPWDPPDSPACQHGHQQAYDLLNSVEQTPDP